MSHLKPTPELLDLLVDGELSESQQKELLSSLDQEPDGWRQCALAFLEAQCWKKELKSIRQPIATNSHPTSQPAIQTNTSTPFRKIHSKAFRVGGTLLAMSACFFLTLSSVLWYRSDNRSENILGNSNSNQIAGKTDYPAATNQSTNTPTSDLSSPWQWVRLTPSDSTDPEQVVELPAIERNQLDPQWAQSLPSPIPADMLEALKQKGYEVHSQQQLLPMPLKDGRQLIVPVDNVQVQYRGNPTY